MKDLLQDLHKGNKRALARSITLVENEIQGHEELLMGLSFSRQIPVIGITGPPGAGKSTLLNAIISYLTAQNKKIGIVAIDPTSPFNFGALLGDRLRMTEHFLNPNVFIRSVATRGALGGLSAKIIEITDVMRASDFDYIFVETVGVGQSEVEIVGLADTTVLVLVPEAGDDIQTIKSGIMEIADVFVLNKADREGADRFIKNLHHAIASHGDWLPPVIKTIATKGEGADKIVEAITLHQQHVINNRRAFLLTEKAFRIIERNRMKDIDKKALYEKIALTYSLPEFNLYAFLKNEFL